MTAAVALVIVGDEVLAGRVVDRNGPWLLERLTRSGARVVSIRTVGDQRDAVAAAVRAAAAEADGVIVTGGLGPTDDDGTRAALAAAAGTALREDPAALEAVLRAQAARGYLLDARRRREALVPEGARALLNPEGTAPGLELTIGTAVVWAVPGVPREARALVEAVVLPALASRHALAPPVSGALRTASLREPDVAEALADLGGGGVAVGYYPHDGELEVRFTALAPDAGFEALSRLAQARRRLGAAAWEDRPVEEEVVHALRRRGVTITTAESMTGGLVARMLTAVPGASDVFPGGWVAYSDAWKEAALEVPHALLASSGAVSSAVAAAMAEGALARAGTDLAVAVTGIAGPGDGADPAGRPIPQGTYHVGLASRGRPTRTLDLRAPLGRTAVQRRAAVAALDLVRASLLDA